MEERKRIIKAKAIKILVIFDIIVACLIYVFVLLESKITEPSTIIFIVGMLIFVIACNLVLFKLIVGIFNDEEERKKSQEEVEKRLSSKEYIEVVPIKSDKYENFILKLSKEGKAKFYAIIIAGDKNRVKISIKFNNEEKLWDLEDIGAEFFSDYYEIGSKDKRM